MHVPQLGGGAEILNGCADLYMVGEVGIGTSFRRGFAAATAELSTVIQLTGGTLSKALAMHLGAVLPNVSHSVNLDDQYAEDATGGRLEIDEGSTPVPEGPGLGIDIDEEKLAELAARPKSELPTHVGVLELPGGSTYYTPSIPSAEQPQRLPGRQRPRHTQPRVERRWIRGFQGHLPTRPERRGLQGIVYRSAPVGPRTGALSHQNKVDQQTGIG